MRLNDADESSHSSGHGIDAFAHLVNPLANLSQIFLVLPLHGSDDLHGLGQRFMPLGEPVYSFFESHSLRLLVLAYLKKTRQVATTKAWVTIEERTVPVCT